MPAYAGISLNSGWVRINNMQKALSFNSMTTLTPPRTPAGGNHGVLFLMLSLQLLLISFFILLNTMATPKANRQHSAPPSLTGFAGVDNHNGTGQHQATWDTGPMQVVKVHQELTGLVQTIFRLTTPPLTSVATQVTLALPLERLYTSTNTLTAEGRAFLTNVLSLATTNPQWQAVVSLGQPISSDRQAIATPVVRAIAILIATQNVTPNWPPNVALRMASGPTQLTLTIHPGTAPNPRSINQLNRVLNN